MMTTATMARPNTASHMGSQAYDLDELPVLKERLGKIKAAKLEYSIRPPHDGGPKRSNREKRVTNTVLEAMQGRDLRAAGCPISDILAGIARLDHHSQKDRNIPLGTIKLYTILQCLEVITTRGVMELLDVGKRQAMLYVRACELAIPYIDAVVSEEEKHDGIALVEAPGF